MMAASQREQALKFEILVPIAGPEPTAIASFNYHQDHFAALYGIDDRRRRRGAHRVPGLRPRADRAGAAAAPTGSTWRAWPAEVRAELWRAERRPRARRLLGADPATYVPHAVHARRTAPTSRPTATPTSSSSCCTRAATSRWRRWARRCGWTSRATSGRSSSPTRATSSGSTASTSTRCSPTGRCPSRSPSSSAAGRTMIVELDAWYLPDTAATSYRTEHVKTSVVARGDRPRRASVLRYFHNAGLHELRGEDYRGVFRLGRVRPTDVLPPYAELVRFDAGPAADAATSCATRRASCCAATWRGGPATNPFVRFGARAGARPAGAARRATRRTTTPTRSRPCGWSGSGFELLARARATGCSARRRGAGRGRGRCDGEIVDGCKLLSLEARAAPGVRPGAGRSPTSPPRGSGRSAGSDAALA